MAQAAENRGSLGVENSAPDPYIGWVENKHPNQVKINEFIRGFRQTDHDKRHFLRDLISYARAIKCGGAQQLSAGQPFRRARRTATEILKQKRGNGWLTPEQIGTVVDFVYNDEAL